MKVSYIMIFLKLYFTQKNERFTQEIFFQRDSLYNEIACRQTTVTVKRIREPNIQLYHRWLERKCVPGERRRNHL